MESKAFMDFYAIDLTKDRKLLVLIFLQAAII